MSKPDKDLAVGFCVATALIGAIGAVWWFIAWVVVRSYSAYEGNGYASAPNDELIVAIVCGAIAISALAVLFWVHKRF